MKLHRADLMFVGGIALFISSCSGAIAYDYSQPEITTYRTDTTFSGMPVVVAYHSGKLGMDHGAKIVGYFGGGNPRFIGFGCDDAHAPVIAIDEDELAHCQTVAPIANAHNELEVR